MASKQQRGVSFSAAAWLGICCVALSWLGVLSRPAVGQVVNWRASVQRTRVVCGLGTHATLPGSWQTTLASQLQYEGLSYLPANSQISATLTVQAAELQPWLIEQVSEAEATVPELPRAWRDDVDQVVLLSVTSQPHGYRLQGRCLDLLTWQWGAVRERSVSSAADVVLAAREVLRQSLLPVVEIEGVDVEARTARVRLRGDRLFAEGGTRPSLQVGDFLRAVVAVPDRQGKYVPAGARVVPWTLLRVAVANPDGTWTCEYESAYSLPLRARRSRRMRQLAYRVEPTGEQTTLQLAYGGELSGPRTGCQVYLQPWRTQTASAGASDDSLVYVGATDWQGKITLNRAQVSELSRAGTGHVLAVKFGARVIARLPILVGLENSARLELADDRPLVDIELFMRAVEQDLLDLVARRQLLALRIRRLLSVGNFADAKSVFNELRSLETQSDFLRRIEAKQRELKIPNSAQRQKIDKVFVDLRELLSKLLSPSFVQSVQDEIATAQRAQPPATSTPTTDNS